MNRFTRYAVGLGTAGLLAAGIATVAVPSAIASTTMNWGEYQSGNNLSYSVSGHYPTESIFYDGWNAYGTNGVSQADMNNAAANHSIPLIEMQTSQTPSTCYSLATVGSGTYNTNLKSFGTTLASEATTAGITQVRLTFDHEMNTNFGFPDSCWNTTSGFTTAQWDTAWNTVVTNVLAGCNASANICQFTFNPNSLSTTVNPNGATAFDPYYNGIATADKPSIIGIDCYLDPNAATYANTCASSVTDAQALVSSVQIAETGVPNTNANAVSQVKSIMSAASYGLYPAYYDAGKWSLTSAMTTEFVGCLSEACP